MVWQLAPCNPGKVQIGVNLIGVHRLDTGVVTGHSGDGDTLTGSGAAVGADLGVVGGGHLPFGAVDSVIIAGWVPLAWVAGGFVCVL